MFQDDVPFRVSDAVAAGRTRPSFDSRHFDMPFHGVRVRLGDERVTVLCAAYALRMRDDAAFTSVTAAALWGIPLPAYVDTRKLRVSVPHGSPRPRSRGVIGSERRPDVDVVRVAGLPVLAPAPTWASLARDLDVGDLIAAGDHVVGAYRRDALATIDDLRAVAARRELGAPRLRPAALRVQFGSQSRPESLSRVLLVESGLPRPSLNHPIPELGSYIDLAWETAKFGFEYQGGHHVESAQHAADVQRQERIHDLGWLLMEATKYDLFDTPLATVARVHARLESRGLKTRRTNPPSWALPRR